MRGLSYSKLLLILVLCLSGCGSTANEPIGQTTDALCARAKLKAGPSAVVPEGTLVSLTTAQPTCAAGEVPEYRFFYRLAGTSAYTEIRGWHTDQVAEWDTSGVAAGKYEVLVRTRPVGTTISGSGATTNVFIGDVCNAVTLGVSPPSPSSPGTEVGLTASATCTGGTPEYRFLSRPPGSSKYTEFRGWDPSPSAVWSSPAVGPHVLKVQTRRAGNATNEEASATKTYSLGETCGSIVASTTPASPAAPDTSVTVSASAACTGSASAQFRFAYRTSGTNAYTVFQDWSAAASAEWDTAGLPAANYQLRIETRAGDYAGKAQATKTLSFVLGGQCSAATLVASPKSPQSIETLVTLTAGATCTGGSPEFQFLVRRPKLPWLTPTYEELRGWGGPTFTWDTIDTWGGAHSLLVRVRAIGNPSAYQAQRAIRYDLDVCNTLQASISPAGAQPAGTLVTVTGTASCLGFATPVYRFLYRPVGTSAWTEFRGWAPDPAQWNTSGLEAGAYQVQVQTRSRWNEMASAEATRTLTYTLLDACPLGQTPDGAGGCIDIEECDPNPCSNGGTCLEEAAGYTCQCTENFMGPNCETGRWSAVSVGIHHSCALRWDGTATCWGSNLFGRATAPPGAFAAVAVGFDHSCGLRPDGSVNCWGDDSQGQATAPPGQFAAISLGWGHSLGLHLDGTASRWGNGFKFWSDSAPVSAGDPLPGTYTAVSAGDFHACGIRLDGTVACWGPTDPLFDLGQSTTTPLGEFASISAGEVHTCGVRLDGTISCWGDNEYGQATPPPGQFSAVAAGGRHSCGLRLDGTIICWGDDTWGQVTTVPPGEFGAVSAAAEFSCGLRLDGSLSCWGPWRDWYAELPPS